MNEKILGQNAIMTKFMDQNADMAKFHGIIQLLEVWYKVLNINKRGVNFSFSFLDKQEYPDLF